MEKKVKKAKVTGFELAAYIVSGVIGLWGLVEICLGIAGMYVPVDSSFAKACAKYKSIFGLTFLGWGLILLGIGTVLAVIVLFVYAKTSDREYEKQQRRAARLGHDTPTDEAKSEVTDAVVEKVE